jgi:hypothetical protein
MSISSKKTDQNRQELENKIADAKHMSKPDAEDTIVVRDANGRWIFEFYLAGHTVRNVLN